MTADSKTVPAPNDSIDEKLVNIDLDLPKNASPSATANKDLSNFFDDMLIEDKKRSTDNTQEQRHIELDKSLTELDLAMDSFIGGASAFDFNKATSLAAPNPQSETNQQTLQYLTSENVALLEDILNSGPSANTEWDSISGDTFLPPGILKQSLGDAILGVNNKESHHRSNEKVQTIYPLFYKSLYLFFFSNFHINFLFTFFSVEGTFWKNKGKFVVGSFC